MDAPYPNQGAPLPASMDARGEWIIENRFFLCRPEHGDWSWSDKCFTVKAPTGKNCIGFKADEVAKCLGLSMEALFEANRQNKLSIGAQPVSSDGTGISTVEFIFLIPGVGVCRLTTKATTTAGLA